MVEETEYQAFFKKALEKAGKSIPSMSDEEKKEFFNKIDAAWNAKGEKNEDLKGDQHKLDVDGDGEIEASDLAALRAGEKKDASVNEAKIKKVDKSKWNKMKFDDRVTALLSVVKDPDDAEEYAESNWEDLPSGFERDMVIYESVEESVNESAGCGCGCGCGGSKMNEEFKSKDSTFEKVYGIFDKKDYFNAKGLAKVQIGNFERALKKNDKGAQQILDKFKGDMDKAKDYIIQVITDRKKEDAFNQYKAFKAAVDSIQKGKPIYGAVDLVKSRIHNNSQKYTMALYSALRNQKFNKWKDIHSDVDSLIGESVNEASDIYTKLADKLIKMGKIKKGSISKGVTDYLGNDLSKKDLAKVSKAAKSMLESVNEEGKTEFEFNGKTYPVTLKESYKGNMSDFKYEFPNTFENETGNSTKAIKKLSKKGKGYEVRTSTYMSEPEMKKVGDALGLKLVNYQKSGNVAVTIYESLNERRLGKVEMLKDVEAGRTSRVEGVKISKDLAFEMRMFLQRPMLSRSRTGIAIDNSQMKEAIPMLAKVGIHKRLSSGVKKEFAELLKKYK